MTAAEEHDQGPRTWHHGLVARWWAEFNRADPDELAYYVAAVRRFGEPALDLACGTGRILVPLLEAGLDVDGVDVSADMLRHAAAAAQAAGMRPTLLRQALHELQPPRRYRTIIICDSWGIGGSRSRDREALRRIHAALEPGGALVLSHDLPYEDAETWQRWLPGSRSGLPDAWPTSGAPRPMADGTALDLRIRLEALDPAEQRLTLGIQARHWRDAELLGLEEMRIDIALYFRAELVEAIERAGFHDVEVQGWYTGQPALPDDARIVVVARA